VIAQTTTRTIATCWHDGVPTLHGGAVSLRELEGRDAATLLELISAPEVAKFISQPPDSIEGFEQFIAWTHEERRRGRYLCLGIVPHGMETAVGLFHIRRLDLGFDTAEWGFAIGSAFWGTGVFHESAELVLDFAFDVIGVTRLEARVAVPNGRAHGALHKVGAVQEAVLRKGVSIHGEVFDQTLWSIVDTDRLDRKNVRQKRIYVH
jgi:[ribosomal protein S5]-alanine N-acetyltransferase